MMHIHILHSVRHPLWKQQPFWYPVALCQRHLKDIGITCEFFTSIYDGLHDCDILCLSSEFFEGFRQPDTQPKALDAVQRITDKVVGTSIWFDLDDSSANTTFEVLPLVTRYLKRQLLRDRKLYHTELYMNRIWCDYFHKNLGITDSVEEPFWPLSKEHECKLGLSWNLGLEDFRRGGLFPRANYRIGDWLETIRGTDHPLPWHSPTAMRDVSLVALFGQNYRAYGKSIKTIGFQRRRAIEILQKLNDSGMVLGDRLPYRQYLSVLKRAKTVLSLFGWGEICWREYEAWIAGAAVLMPDMSHLETWPDLYRPHETYWPLRWDLSDLSDSYCCLMDDEDTRMSLAQNAQQQYRYHWSREGKRVFCHRLGDILTNTADT